MPFVWRDPFYPYENVTPRGLGNSYYPITEGTPATTLIPATSTVFVGALAEAETLPTAYKHALTVEDQRYWQVTLNPEEKWMRRQTEWDEYTRNELRNNYYYKMKWSEGAACNPPAPVTPRDNLIIHNRTRSMRLKEKAARVRALKALLEHLTADQRTEYEKSRCFHVETADGLRRYLIRYGLAGNIKLIESKGLVFGGERDSLLELKEGDTFCWHVVHPEGPIPVEDNLLAQMLHLETEEGEAQMLREANVT